MGLVLREPGIGAAVTAIEFAGAADVAALATSERAIRADAGRTLAGSERPISVGAAFRTNVAAESCDCARGDAAPEIIAATSLTVCGRSFSCTRNAASIAAPNAADTRPLAAIAKGTSGSVLNREIAAGGLLPVRHLYATAPSA